MEKLYSLFHSQPWMYRIGMILLVAFLCHFIIKAVQTIGIIVVSPEKAPKISRKEIFSKRHPKVATVVNLAVSALTFIIYFFAIGFILKEFNISLTAYFATATVVGLAVGFGTQGLVQDVVSGLTLVFSDAFDIGDMIETSGQIGKVEGIGLRFTRITNILNESVYIPNRNIAVFGRFMKGHVRAYADIQLPDQMAETELIALAEKNAKGVYEQHRAIFMGEPESFGIKETAAGGWKYLRIRFRIWPGQNAVVETLFRQRLLADLKAKIPGYADWMIAVTYRAA